MSAKWANAYSLGELVEFRFPVTFEDVITRGDGRWIRAIITKFQKGSNLPRVRILEGSGGEFQVVRKDELRKLDSRTELLREMIEHDVTEDCARLGRALEVICANQGC